MKLKKNTPSSSLQIETKFSSSCNYLTPLISLDSKKVYLSKGITISVYSLLSGDLLQSLKGHDEKIIGMCHYPQNKDSIISCDIKGNVVIWNHGKSLKQEHFSLVEPKDLKEGKLCYFNISKNKTALFCVEQDNKRTLFSTHLENPSKKYKISSKIKLGCNCISLSKNGMLLGILEGDYQAVSFKYPFMKEKWRWRLQNKVSCIACHPEEDTIAVGDNIGSIALFYTNKSREDLHWHTLPVVDLAFSPIGTELYSGGGECVLVRWQLGENYRRSCIPRLGSPLASIAIDGFNSKIVVVHNDRDVSVIDSYRQALEGKICRVKYHDSDDPLPAGLLVIPGTETVILNGQTGHLQFYEPLKDNLLYQLDTTMCNFLSRERHKVLPNPEVVKIAISSNGKWLATCEKCHLSQRLLEIVLKFWVFSEENQRWELNTSVDSPHTINLNSISFISSSSSEVQLCVTCGEDEQFKVWQLFYYKDAKGIHNCHWNCTSAREFRSLPATASCFSQDGSLLSVSFDSIITMWKVDNCQLIGTLSQPFLRERIKQVFFCGGDSDGALLVSHSDSHICSWDLLSCSLLWHVSMNTVHLVVNPVSGYIAAFSTTNTVQILSPKSSKVLATKDKISDTKVIAAAFVPSIQSHEKGKSSAVFPWKSNHNLVFINKDQLFYTVDMSRAKKGASTTDSVEMETLPDESTYHSAFSMTLPATRKVNDPDKKSSSQHSFSQPKFLEMLDSSRIHNMQPFSSMLKSCLSFIPAPVIQKSKIDFEYVTKKAASEATTPLEKSLEDLSLEEEIEPNLLDRISDIDYQQIVKEIS